MKFWVSSSNYEGLRAKPPAAGGNKGSRSGIPSFVDFCSFLIKILHFEAYLSLNFYKNLFLSL